MSKELSIKIFIFILFISVFFFFNYDGKEIQIIDILELPIKVSRTKLLKSNFVLEPVSLENDNRSFTIKKNNVKFKYRKYELVGNFSSEVDINGAIYFFYITDSFEEAKLIAHMANFTCYELKNGDEVSINIVDYLYLYVDIDKKTVFIKKF